MKRRTEKKQRSKARALQQKAWNRYCDRCDPDTRMTLSIAIRILRSPLDQYGLGVRGKVTTRMAFGGYLLRGLWE